MHIKMVEHYVLLMCGCKFNPHQLCILCPYIMIGGLKMNRTSITLKKMTKWWVTRTTKRRNLKVDHLRPCHSWHIPEDVRFGEGGGCRDVVCPKVENMGKCKGKEVANCTYLFIKIKVNGIVIRAIDLRLLV